MATQPSPSPAAKGKKPMAYPQHSQQIIQTQQAQQQQPRSERAASKAPLAYQAPTPAQNRHPSPPSSNTSKSKNTNPLTNQKGKANANKIWSTSTTEERERIKEFWLGLSEEERRDLVKIEKDTVLKKMKEQQKHSCSCAVCGRKRFVSVHFFKMLCNFFPPIALIFSFIMVFVTSDMFTFSVSLLQPRFYLLINI